MATVTTVDSGDTRQRSVSRQQHCATTGDTWQGRAQRRGKGSMEWEKGRAHKGKGEVVESERKGKGKGPQSMSECDMGPEW